jgi:hypothetical protein
MTWRRERRCLASLRLRARASRRRQGNRLARPPGLAARQEPRARRGRRRGVLGGAAGVVAQKGRVFFLYAWWRTVGEQRPRAEIAQVLGMHPVLKGCRQAVIIEHSRVARG